MFSKKKTTSVKNGVQKEKKDLDLKIITIPNDFYAGANPVIKFKEVEKIVDVSKVKGSELKDFEKRIFDKSESVGSDESAHPANFLTSRKFLILSVIILFIIFIIIATVYYLWQSRLEKTVKIPDPITDHIPAVADNLAPTSSVIITTTTIIATTTESDSIDLIKDIKIEFPSTLLSESADFDSDGITDMAEDVFNLDPANFDTDGDKYPDSFELFYLYNPNGFEPKKIIDSGLVSLFSSNNLLYKTYYPKGWVVGMIDSDESNILFSTLTGENIELRVFDLDLDETTEDWFKEEAEDEDLSKYVDFESRFGILGKKRDDGLVYILNKDNRIFAFIYHIADSGVVNYKIIIELMARSFDIFEKDSQVSSDLTTFPQDAPGITTTPSNEELLNDVSTSTESADEDSTDNQ